MSGAWHSFHGLRVGEIERLTDDAVAITLEVPPALAPVFRFEAGQHLNVRVPGGGDERRTYSVAASALTQRLRIGVRRLEGGAFSPYAVDALTTGDILHVAPPAGAFVLHPRPDAARTVVAVAAGSGITPVLSILTTLLEAEPASRAVLIYGNRTTASVMFLDDLADLKDRWPGRFEVLHVLSREDRDARLLNGRITAERLRELLDAFVPPAAVDAWYVCGPQEMADGVRQGLVAAGVPADRVHSELFHVGDSAPPPIRRLAPAAGVPVTIRLDGRSVHAVAGAEESLLEVALRVRPDAPFACRGGICGTCRARVSGEVETVRDFALEPEERAAGLVLSCQSYPVGGPVTVDYDV